MEMDKRFYKIVKKKEYKIQSQYTIIMGISFSFFDFSWRSAHLIQFNSSPTGSHIIWVRQWWYYLLFVDNRRRQSHWRCWWLMLLVLKKRGLVTRYRFFFLSSCFVCLSLSICSCLNVRIGLARLAVVSRLLRVNIINTCDQQWRGWLWMAHGHSFGHIFFWSCEIGCDFVDMNVSSANRNHRTRIMFTAGLFVCLFGVFLWLRRVICVSKR